MADVTISELSPATALSDNDLVELEQDGSPGNRSVMANLAQLRAYIMASHANVQTGTTYTLGLADAFNLVTMNNAAANTLAVPPHSSVPFPVQTRIDLGQDGAGRTTIVAGEGVIIRTPETMKMRKQWGKATLIKRAPNVWDLEGNLEPAS